MRNRSIILLEANEIPLRIFDYFCGLHPNSSIARVMEHGKSYRAHAEDKARFIMPWTTWPSFHRGVIDEIHQIFSFGQWETEADQRYPPIWAMLARNSVRTGVFSSMQSAPLPARSDAYAFYVPDMFATNSATEPPELQPFQSFNLSMTRDSARNVSQRIDLERGFQVLLKSMSLGIRANTYTKIGKQLLSEFRDASRKTRRRAYQPLLMFDVFMKQLRMKRPHFSTFFTNHVAAAMHRYWAAAFPEDYQEFNLDRSWVEKYRAEIDFAMLMLDEIVGRLCSFIDTNADYLLVIATSMGQAAIPASHVREFLTITNFDKFLSFLNLPEADVDRRPAMVPDFSFSVTASKAADVEVSLNNLSIDGKPAQFSRVDGFFHISIYDERPGITSATVCGRTVPIEMLGFGYLVHEDEVSCTAQHVPEGSLIVYSPHSDARTSSTRTDISALDFSPAILRHFGLDVPSYMRQSAFAVDY